MSECPPWSRRALTSRSSSRQPTTAQESSEMATYNRYFFSPSAGSSKKCYQHCPPIHLLLLHCPCPASFPSRQRRRQEEGGGKAKEAEEEDEKGLTR
eukprot:7067141-Pyramimonas_sp.AAC.1